MTTKRNPTRTATSRIYVDLRRRLIGGEFEPGSQLPSLRRMAESYSASKATVQAVLGQLKHEGLVTAEHGRGCFAAGQPVRMHRVLLLNPTEGHEWADYTQAFVAASSGCPDVSLLIEGAGRTDRDHLQQKVTAHLVEGVQTIIFNGLFDFDLNFVPSFAERADVICFYSADVLRSRPCPAVTSDWWRGGEMAIEHLRDRGCDEVLMVTHATSGGELKNIERGAEAAADRLGMKLHTLAADVKDANYAADMKGMLDANRGITGLFATADYRIVPQLASLRAWGYSVPGRLKVVGYFNTPWSEVCEPGLTSICTRPAEIARRVMSMLSRPLENVRERVEPVLVERGSTSV